MRELVVIIERLRSLPGYIYVIAAAVVFFLCTIKIGRPAFLAAFLRSTILRFTRVFEAGRNAWRSSPPPESSPCRAEIEEIERESIPPPGTRDSAIAALGRLNLIVNPGDRENTPGKTQPGRPASLSRVLEQLGAVKDELTYGQRSVLQDFEYILDPRAIEEAKERLAKSPDNPELLDWLAFIYYTNDLVEKALEVYKRLASEYPDVCGHFFYLGNTFFKMNLLPEALFCWNKVLDLNPPMKMLERTSSSISTARGMMKQWLELGMKLEPSDPFIVELSGSGRVNAAPEQSTPPGKQSLLPGENRTEPRDEHTADLESPKTEGALTTKEGPDCLDAVPGAHFDSLRRFHSINDSEELALHQAFREIFSDPGSPALLESRSPCKRPAAAPPIWPLSSLKSMLAGCSSSIARISALKRLFFPAATTPDEDLSNNEELNKILAATISSGEPGEAALACAVLVLHRRHLDLPPADYSKLLTRGGDSSPLLAASLIHVSPERSVELLEEWWKLGHSRQTRLDLIRNLSKLGLPEPRPGIISLLCAAAEDEAELETIIELVAPAPRPEDLAPLIEKLCFFFSRGSKRLKSLCKALHRLSRTEVLRSRLDTLGPCVSALRLQVKEVYSFYNDRAPQSAAAFLTSTLMRTLRNADLKSFLGILKEEAIGNLEQAVPGLAGVKGAKAIENLLHPRVLTSFGILSALFRYCPGGDSENPAQNDLALLATCCFGMSSFGTLFYERLRRKLQQGNEIQNLLWIERDDVEASHFSGLVLSTSSILDRLLDDPLEAPDYAKLRCLSILAEAPVPALLAWTLDLLASQNSIPPLVDAAKSLLLRHKGLMRHLLPVILDSRDKDRTVHVLSLLPDFADNYCLDVLKPRLRFLLELCPEQVLWAVDEMAAWGLLAELSALVGDVELDEKTERRARKVIDRLGAIADAIPENRSST